MKGRVLPEILLRTEELDRCVNCGLCRAVCPTFLTIGNERLTARGKIILLKELLDDSLEPSASIAEIFDDCLTCYACQSVCPAGVRTEKLWTSARQDLAGKSKTDRIKKLGLGWTIARPKLFGLQIRLAGRLTGFDVNNREQAALAKWGFPVFRSAPLLHSLNDEYPATGKEFGSVGLLLGCSVNISTPWVADATIKLLNAAGWRVVVAKEQVCCGAPAINNASWDIARKLARRNMIVFRSLGVDRVTSADATCAGAFQRDYPELFREDEEARMAAVELSEMTVDLSELLFEACEDGRLRFNPREEVVTLHDSCHVTHVSRGGRWRQLLERVEGLNIRELKDSDHCCGFGGSYAFFHRETSMKIAERKVERIIETGADKVLVGSPGCMLRIQSVLNAKTDRVVKVMHVAEFLSELV